MACALLPLVLQCSTQQCVDCSWHQVTAVSVLVSLLIPLFLQVLAQCKKRRRSCYHIGELAHNCGCVHSYNFISCWFMCNSLQVKLSMATLKMKLGGVPASIQLRALLIIMKCEIWTANAMCSDGTRESNSKSTLRALKSI